MDDFWIGDLVFDEKSGLQGKFEGRIAPNQVKINATGKTYLLNEPKLRLMTAGEQEVYLEALEEELPKNPGKTTATKAYSNAIDLHIEILAPQMTSKSFEAILHRQLSATRHFIEDSIKRRQYQLLIIHGKGTGALKMEIDMLLHNYPQINEWKEVNDGGATRVHLKYPVSW